ncbi:MAG: membrane protein insertase YidC [Saprospiraceae bacterium]|nr:membrane protein insertase YidC [Saprospiraceae bacterium]
MNQDNKNAMIGMVLILLILLGWNMLSTPSQAELEQKKRTQDSIANVQRINDSLQKATAPTQVPPSVSDSLKKAQLSNEMGNFASLAIGNEQTSVLENENIKVTFTNKGGKIQNVVLKKFKRILENEKREDVITPLYLLEDTKNKFGFNIPTNTASGSVSTENLYFTPSVSGNILTFRAMLNDQVGFEQRYTLGSGYDLDYSVKFNGLSSVLKSDAKSIQLNWENNLDKLEKNVNYESSYSYLHFKESDSSPDYLSGTSSDKKELTKYPIEWVTNSNQFFSTILIAPAGNGFKSAILETENHDLKHEDLKKMITRLEIPTDAFANGYAMKMYIGPNDYGILSKYDNKLEQVVDYGGSILGTINRWVIRPIFDFLHSIIGNVAICILLLTFLVKAILYPLSYKMLMSQAKTTALKPEIEKMKAKFKDDQQRIQTEQMKLYGEYGVNPLGGCLPTLLQMPIWMALFRFFPATIDFRQQGFLWAKDLSGFEEFMKLGFYVPMYGAHVSLFALLWGLSLLVFTWYSMKDVDMSGQPAAMKYMQYFTPLIFMLVFNSYAAGLSLYMLFSNILNIGQTIVTKNYIIDHDKIRQELEEHKKKPKKQSFFRQKLDEAMKQQQEMAKQQQQKKK